MSSTATIQLAFLLGIVTGLCSSAAAQPLPAAVWVTVSPGITVNGTALPAGGLPGWALRPGDRVRTSETPVRVSIGDYGSVVLGRNSELEVFDTGSGIGLRLISGEMAWDLRNPAAVPLWVADKQLDTGQQRKGAVEVLKNGRPVPARSRHNGGPLTVPAEPLERSLSTSSCEGTVQALPPRARCREWPAGGVAPASPPGER